MANNDFVGLMVALVNKPFNITKYIFANMRETLRRTGSVIGSSKFWMYTRFLQMIMNVQHPNLPKEDNDVLKFKVMKEMSLKVLKGFSAKSYKESDPPRELFGFLDNNEYVAQENDKWRHDNIESDDEEPTMNKKIEDKFGKKDDNDDDESDGSEGGDGGAVGTSGTGSTGGDRGTEQDEDYVPSDTESEKARKKQVVIQRKNQSRKTIGESQAQPASMQPSEPCSTSGGRSSACFLC
ncbi:hypothetical protein HanPI659440_Chr04g0140261 [Helianthus annuus]|nr:hypothetical protein HanPI659440_Chr04g0140261 [Helianthus annuus]